MYVRTQARADESHDDEEQPPAHFFRSPPSLSFHSSSYPLFADRVNYGNGTDRRNEDEVPFGWNR